MSDPAFKPPRHIAIEGPIRVGKSTLAKVLAEQLHARRIFDADDNPFLTDFYDEKPGSAFRAQMYFLYERHRRLLDASPEADPAPIISDFLFEKDKIFAYLNLDNEELALRRIDQAQEAPVLGIASARAGGSVCSRRHGERAAGSRAGSGDLLAGQARGVA